MEPYREEIQVWRPKAFRVGPDYLLAKRNGNTPKRCGLKARSGCRLQGNRITLTLGLYLEKRLTAAQKRFTRACETLARVRKLSRNTPALQLNIAANRRTTNQSCPIGSFLTDLARRLAVPNEFRRLLNLQVQNSIRIILIL